MIVAGQRQPILIATRPVTSAAAIVAGTLLLAQRAKTKGFATERIALLVLWLLATMLQLAFRRGLRSASPPACVRRPSLKLAVVARVATVWTLLSVAVTSVCLPSG